MVHMRRATGLFVVVVYGALLNGCAVLPTRGPVVQSHAVLDVGSTLLARTAAHASRTVAGSLSGFRVLPEGSFAFNARIALARRAEKTLDVQYYQIRNDDIGRRFLRELRDAAVRGVRVRVLIDDLYAAGEDELFSGLAAYPNVELRIFNPLPWREGGFNTRFLFSLTDFGRINHRMHNKLFIADNTFSVSGGRNIADEYFMRSEEANFVDLDVLSSGPVVGQLSDVFDTYWNSSRVYPIVQLIGHFSSPPVFRAARESFDRMTRDAPDLPERDRDILGHGGVAAQLDSGVLDQVFAPARVFADSPEKVEGASDANAPNTTVNAQTLALFTAAQDSVEIISPYLVPDERAMAMMRQGLERGGRIDLITNSADATDEPLVYAGYARYRLAMLEAGIHIYELGPDLSSHFGKLGEFGASYGRLHVKAAVIDGHLIFIGSMNMDARSANINTESGLVIDRAELVGGTNGTASLRDLLKSSAYELRLSADGKRIEWVEHRPDGSSLVHSEEPGTSFWQRLKLRLLSPFVGEELL